MSFKERRARQVHSVGDGAEASRGRPASAALLGTARHPAQDSLWLEPEGEHHSPVTVLPRRGDPCAPRCLLRLPCLWVPASVFKSARFLGKENQRALVS